jgi:phospholipase A-2-activating protein
MERHAPVGEITAFDEAVAAQAIPTNQVGDVDKSKLPGIEALASPGAKNGQVLMVKSGNVVEAHQWDGPSEKWIKIGEVVDAVDPSSRKKMYQNVEYDYVFDVDVFEGAPPLKLPFNNSENPYAAAQVFITANELPQDYLVLIYDAHGIGTNSEFHCHKCTGQDYWRGASHVQ